MPSILSDADKETVKRNVPKPSNKIHAVAVARLYVAYPDPQRWVYTGLQGAAVLANDLVGRTFWLKMVDVSVSATTTFPYKESLTDALFFWAIACRKRRYLGSRDIRQFPLQPRPDILPYVRARRLPGRSIIRR